MPDPSFDVSEFLATLSQKPGVYVYRDFNDDVLYVGKAKNLKSRVSSYFRKNQLQTKTMLLVSKIASAETQQTHTETEALLLENNLIKQYKPRYNVLLKDDKSYPFIRLVTNTPAPWLKHHRGSRAAPGRYFGPYPNGSAVRETLNQLERLFRLRQCSESVFKNRSRPCLQYQIKRCSAPCVDKISKQAYQEDIRQATAFLEGRDTRLIDELGEQMQQAAESLDFELAVVYRDRISALKTVQEKQYVTGESGDADVISIASEGGMACFFVAHYRHGRNLGGRYHLQKNPLGQDDSDLLEAFVTQYYLEHPPEQEILLNAPLPNESWVAQALSEIAEHKVSLKTQVRGQRKRWMGSATLNARDHLTTTLMKRSTIEAQYVALEKLLMLEQPLNRMECFDISHTSGTRTVASCVVFDRAGAKTTDYRRFNIRGIEPGDDYAAMRQTLLRRYQKLIETDAVLPDLIIIDGGKGQLSMAIEVLQELQRADIPLLGISKGPERKAGEEKLHLAHQGRIIEPGLHSQALHLLQQIRDEAHRFAITGHRMRRSKTMKRSTLEDIDGIGEKRRSALLKHFGGLQAIKQAGVEDLTQVDGISPVLAEKIYQRFH